MPTTLTDAVNNLVTNTSNLQATVSGRITDMDNKVNLADAAKLAAETAKAGAELAKGLADTASTDAITAQTLAENAKAAALTAQGIAATAKTDALTAQTSSESAKNNSQAAQTASENAKNLAQDWATKTTGAVEGGKYSAKFHATAAGADASISSTKAGEAAVSATTATTQAGISTTKASEASASSTNANTKAGEAAASETAAATSATAASSSASTATTKASEANTSKLAAASSATAASGSASTASTKASEASASASAAATTLADRYTKSETDAKIVELSPPATKAHVDSLGINAATLTGSLPAIDGSNLTGIDAVVVGTALPNPVSPEGSLFYKSDNDIFYISNGTQWSLVSNASPATTGGTVTIPSVNEGASLSYQLGTDFEDDVDTDGELTYTLASGTMPGGYILPSPGNTAMYGTASAVSSNTNYTWTIKATDTSGGTSTQNYQQTINNVPPSFLSPPSGNIATVYDSNRDIDVTVNASSATGATITYTISAGSLPNGVALNSSTGVISGVSNSVASDTQTNFTIRATEADGTTSDRDFNIITKALVVTNFSWAGRSVQSWTVPAGIYEFKAYLWGGAGSAGGNGAGSGGGGGYTWVHVTTQPGVTFKLWVPESGFGTDQNGGGGGYAKIVYSTETDSNTVAVAGGGGGFGTTQTAGQGGGATTATTGYYYGASQTSGGAAASCGGSCTSGGTPPFGFWTCAGAHWQGGHGAGGDNDGKGWSGGWPGGGSAGGGNGCNGAGGGGGWYGGGNGGDRGANGASAAGGSSYIAGITSGSSNIAGASATVINGGTAGGGQTGVPGNTSSVYYPGGGIAYGSNTGGFWIGNAAGGSTGGGHQAGKGYIVITY